MEGTMAAEAHRSRVLLVEDEFLLCDMLREALAEHGFEVHSHEHVLYGLCASCRQS